MHTVYVGLGSNVGDRIRYVAEAVRGLSAFEQTTVTAVSDVYQTEPVGVAGQDDFLNVTLGMTTILDHNEFHAGIKKLEQEIGRKETIRWGPREIDIDLLLFDDLIVSSDRLTIPHREMYNRKFVLQPLSDIAPDVVHPAMHRTILELNNECTDTHRVQKSEPFSKQLNALINDPITNPTR